MEFHSGTLELVLPGLCINPENCLVHKEFVSRLTIEGRGQKHVSACFIFLKVSSFLKHILDLHLKCPIKIKTGLIEMEPWGLDCILPNIGIMLILWNSDIILIYSKESTIVFWIQNVLITRTLNMKLLKTILSFIFCMFPL